jgi:hypothetical protein
MDWYFLVSKSTDEVAYIAMASGEGGVLIALFNVHDEENPPYDYWRMCTLDELEDFICGEYEVYVFNEESLDDEPSEIDPNPDKEIEWQIPLVQRWARGESLYRHHVEPVSTFVGNGMQFHPSQFERGEIRPKTNADPFEPMPNRSPHRCLWCDAGLERRYNFSAKWLADFSEVPEEIENPILWSDGNWGDLDGYELFLALPNQYGDSLVTCSICKAAFLASSLERTIDNSRNRETLSSPSSEPLVLPGSCDRRANGSLESDGWLVQSQVETCAQFLEMCQESEGISWDEWTAAQQLLARVADRVRDQLLAGQAPKVEDEERYKSLLRVFVARIGQILEGSLGSIGPYSKLHTVEIQYKNFSTHAYQYNEVIQVANMKRVCGESGQYIELDWATPRHVFVDDWSQITYWDDFDDWVASYGMMVRDAARDGVTDWVFAVRPDGKRVAFEQ